MTDTERADGLAKSDTPPVPHRTWDTTIGPDGIGYLVEALPSGVVRWPYDEANGIDVGLVASLAGALWNFFGRALFGFGWQVRVSRARARWPFTRTVVSRRRMRTKADALDQLPRLVAEVHAHGPTALGSGV